VRLQARRDEVATLVFSTNFVVLGYVVFLFLDLGMLAVRGIAA